MSNWEPCVEVESLHGTKEVSLVTRNLKDRRIFLKGEINSEAANRFLLQFMYLEEEANEPIVIFINSPGGEVDAGLMIYDLIRGSRNEVITVCMGMAASMAATIFAGGRKGRRYILKHSRVMIHEPLIANGVGGSASSIRNISESIMNTRDILNGILAEHTGKTPEEINQATEFDNFMNAEEAVEFGICDKIIENPVHLA